MSEEEKEEERRRKKRTLPLLLLLFFSLRGKRCSMREWEAKKKEEDEKEGNLLPHFRLFFSPF